MDDEFKERLARLKASSDAQHKDSKKSPSPESKKPSLQERIKYGFKKVAIVGAVAVPLFLLLTKDFLFKNRDYPERNVLFTTINEIEVKGSGEDKLKVQDRKSRIEVYQGGSIESKIGTFLFQTTRGIKENIEYFNMENSQHIRIASATRKSETVQAGIRKRGSLTFKEQFAEIVTRMDSKAPENYAVYKFGPERGLKEKEITVVEQKENGKITRTLENRLIELRQWPFGWFLGKDFRYGTFLEQYLKNQKKEELSKKFLDLISILDSSKVMRMGERESLMNKVQELEKDMQIIPIYTSFEDGILDWLPQGGTVYLAHHPSLVERLKDGLGLWKQKHARVRMDRYWDFFPLGLTPGNVPLLNRISFFNKYNLGGYKIRDKFGDLAKVDVKDFWLFYGYDLLYSYYLDMNGDGKLDKDEVIGRVLCKITPEVRNEIKTLGRGKIPSRDIRIKIPYSFMSPTPNQEKGMEYLRLCAYTESFMPDQVHRGFGKHSLLGFINEQRSDIMLYDSHREIVGSSLPNNPNFIVSRNEGRALMENMSRSLTEESTLVAPKDIVRVLIAAKRPYAEEVARAYGLYDEFREKFETSQMLRERKDYYPLIKLGLLAVGAGLGAYYLRRRREKQGNK